MKNKKISLLTTFFLLLILPITQAEILEYNSGSGSNLFSAFWYRDNTADPPPISTEPTSLVKQVDLSTNSKISGFDDISASTLTPASNEHGYFWAELEILSLLDQGQINNITYEGAAYGDLTATKCHQWWIYNFTSSSWKNQTGNPICQDADTITLSSYTVNFSTDLYNQSTGETFFLAQEVNDTSDAWNIDYANFKLDFDRYLQSNKPTQEQILKEKNVIFNVTSSVAINSCLITINGQNNQSMSSLNATTYTYEQTNFDEKNHTFLYYCNRTENQGWINSGNISFEIDDNPRVSFHSNTSNNTLAESHIYASALANDTTPKTNWFSFLLYKGVALINNVTSSQTSFSFNFTSLTDGEYTINASVFDLDNDYNSTIQTVTLANPPIFGSVFVFNSNPSYLENVTYNTTVTDTDNISSYTIFDNRTGVFLNNTFYTSNNTNENISLDLLVNISYPNTFCAGFWANDSVGNKAQSLISCVSISNTLPVLQSVSNTSLHHNVNLSTELNCSDNGENTLYYFNNNSLVTTNSSGWLLDDPTQTEEGNYSILLICGDTFDNDTTIFNYEILNFAPQINTLKFNPTLNNGFNELLFNVTLKDNESDQIYNWTKWYKNGIYNSSWDNQFNIGQNNFTSGDLLKVNLIIGDGVKNVSSNHSQTINDTLFPTINSIQVSNQNPVTTESVQFIVNVTDNESLMESDSCKLTLRKTDYNGGNGVGAYFNVSSNNVQGDLVSVLLTMSPYGVGTLLWNGTHCTDTSGNTIFASDSISLEISLQTTPGSGGGGGGGGLDEEEVVEIFSQQAFCGNLVCDTGENPFTCSSDCVPNIDDLLPGGDRFILGEAGFATFLFWFTIAGVIFVVFRSQNLPRTRRR